ncbi:MAG TPA: hypothetical protein VHN78_14060, partial [Chloroflexota bacterium]|nr:hypothetical protein [Chloroflexota bacterium]
MAPWTRRGLIRSGALAGLLPAACRAGGAGTGGADATKVAAPVRIDWAIYDSPTYREAQAEGAQLYRRKRPNVTFELLGFTDNTKPVTEWLAGAGPHVSMQYGTPLVDSGRKGFFVGLDPYVKRDSKDLPMDDYVPFQLQATTWPAVGRFGLPMYINIYALYFNRTIFQRKGVAPPDETWDWAKYQEALLKASDKEQGVWGGVIVNAALGSSKLHQNGADVMDERDDRKAAVASPAALEALQWVHDRLWRDSSWAQSDVVGKAGFRNSSAMLAGGKLASMENGSGSLADLAKLYPDAAGDWDIAPLPRQKQRAARASIDAWVVAKHAPAHDVMWDFLKFLQTGEYLDAQARLAGAQHARISMQDRYVDLMKRSIPTLADKNVAAFAHAVKHKYARPQAIFRKDDDAWKILNEAWAATMIRNEQPVPDAFRD